MAGAVAEVSGPAPALALVEELDLGTYYLWHAVRAELLRRLDRRPEASTAYAAAIELADNAAEGEFLRRARSALG